MELYINFVIETILYIKFKINEIKQNIMFTFIHTVFQYLIREITLVRDLLWTLQK